MNFYRFGYDFYLDFSGNKGENVFDLFFKSSSQHIVGFVHNEKFQMVGLQEFSFHHVMNSSWGSYRINLIFLKTK